MRLVSWLWGQWTPETRWLASSRRQCLRINNPKAWSRRDPCMLTIHIYACISPFPCVGKQCMATYYPSSYSSSLVGKVARQNTLQLTKDIFLIKKRKGRTNIHPSGLSSSSRLMRRVWLLINKVLIYALWWDNSFMLLVKRAECTSAGYVFNGKPLVWGSCSCFSGFGIEL